METREDLVIAQAAPFCMAWPERKDYLKGWLVKADLELLLEMGDHLGETDPGLGQQVLP